MNIPYLDLKAVTALHGEEIQAAVAEVVGSGWYLQGRALQQFEQHYAEYIGTKYCIGVANGLDALTLTLRAYKEMGKLQEGDEVLVPANTFIATVLSITENQLKPVFVDVEEDTLDLNLAALERAITSKTKVLMLVHLYGRCTYNERIQKLCEKHRLLLVEDNAQAHGCQYEDKKTGSLGQAACHSFYPGKNLGALGDGGAVTTDDEDLAQMIRSIANYGFAEKYVATYQGRNSRLDEVQAAVLNVKLRHLNEENQRRIDLARLYYNKIENETIRLPKLMDEGNNVYHIFPVFTKRRDALKQYLQDKGIGTLIHYPIPPHQQECYKEYNQQSLPITEKLAKEELSLPLNPTMTEEEAMWVVKALNDWK
ncbi:MAG: DegT/DnrJ/EryC1/StrS family aminotransferase [Bacteroidaceae bacterium]|nr:DegT/DnrJ/EryC1/StrS family aminotransferase [Bacteroidaceae bacterium]